MFAVSMWDFVMDSQAFCGTAKDALAPISIHYLATNLSPIADVWCRDSTAPKGGEFAAMEFGCSFRLALWATALFLIAESFLEFFPAHHAAYRDCSGSAPAVGVIALHRAKRGFGCAGAGLLNVKLVEAFFAIAILALFWATRKTNLAFAMRWWPVRVVAFSATILSFFSAGKCLAAHTGMVDGFHAVIIPRPCMSATYFEIMCQEVQQEHDRSRLFVDVEPMPVSLFDGVDA